MPQEAELTAEKLGEWLRRHQRDCERMQYLTPDPATAEKRAVEAGQPHHLQSRQVHC